MADHYETLGVARNATDAELKRAYRKLARKHHPDTNPGDPEAEARFKKVNAAYEVLSDADRRSMYDRFGTDDMKSVRGNDVFASGFGNLFDAFFGQDSPFGANPYGGGAPRRPVRGEDLEAHIDLHLEDVLSGTQRKVDVRTSVRCDRCESSGVEPGTSPRHCNQCDGKGQVRYERNTMLGRTISTMPCDQCRGMGEIIDPDSLCMACAGDGRVAKQHTHTIEVPPGVDDGVTLRIADRGAVGPRGGPNGDLYVHTRVLPHTKFQRDGDDLVHELRIPFTQAVLGTRLDYKTLDDNESITIKPGSPTGTEIRLRGKGVPNVRGSRRGDLYIKLVVDVPTDLTSEQEEIVRQLAAARGEKVTEPRGGLLNKIRSALS